MYFDLNHSYEYYDSREELLHHPKCTCCGEFIISDHLFNIAGDLYCAECLLENFQEDTDDYIS